ncbi:unnamed protein product [Owenia fusiformis]|uniref:Uncharacterized protein n=1 Tax=Owenia fusiformis TaxID=6347 RepID=A0A8S4NBE1_OWEFU|nr:unnamed protein product [Owenia fusiformis]
MQKLSEKIDWFVYGVDTLLGTFLRHPIHQICPYNIYRSLGHPTPSLLFRKLRETFENDNGQHLNNFLYKLHKNMFKFMESLLKSTYAKMMNTNETQIAKLENTMTGVRLCTCICHIDSCNVICEF